MLDKNLLEKYIADRLSIKTMAEFLKCSRQTVMKYIKKYELQASHLLKATDIYKICSKCKIQKNKSEFYFRKSGKIFPSCKECNISDRKRWDTHKNSKKLFVEYKGGKCIICGYSLCYSALDFHHLDPKSKDFQIGQKTSLTNDVKKELDKCILVCCRCHREIHSNLHQILLASIKQTT